MISSWLAHLDNPPVVSQRTPCLECARGWGSQLPWTSWKVQRPISQLCSRLDNNFGKLGVLFRCWWNRFFPSWNERYMYQSSSIPTGRMQRPSTYLQMLLGHWAMEHTLMGHGSAVITISAVPTTENYSQAQHELWHYS